MAAYLICDVSVSDPFRYEQYLQQSLTLLKRYGARVIAFQDGPETIEGDWTPQRAAIVEFKDMNTAKEWYGSSAYQELKEMRAGAGVAKLVLAEGT
jgi:uncharacterized protein (DUF1330 family)